MTRADASRAKLERLCDKLDLQQSDRDDRRRAGRGRVNGARG